MGKFCSECGRVMEQTACLHESRSRWAAVCQEMNAIAIREGWTDRVILSANPCDNIPCKKPEILEQGRVLTEVASCFAGAFERQPAFKDLPNLVYHAVLDAEKWRDRPKFIGELAESDITGRAGMFSWGFITSWKIDHEKSERGKCWRGSFTSSVAFELGRVASISLVSESGRCWHGLVSITRVGGVVRDRYDFYGESNPLIDGKELA